MKLPEIVSARVAGPKGLGSGEARGERREARGERREARGERREAEGGEWEAVGQWGSGAVGQWGSGAVGVEQGAAWVGVWGFLVFLGFRLKIGGRGDRSIHFARSNSFIAFMDEAGSHAKAQLNPLGGGDFSLLPAPSRSLENSLPWSLDCLRWHPRGAAVSTVSHITRRIRCPNPGYRTVPVGATLVVCDDADSNAKQIPSLADIDSLRDLRPQVDPYGFASGQAPATRRQIDIPLTYDDLAVPLDQPKPVMDRFSATATVQQKRLEQDRIAGLVMPPMESLPLAQQQELISVAKSIAPAETQTQSRASGRLASTFAADASAYASSGSQLETLPARARG